MLGILTLIESALIALTPAAKPLTENGLLVGATAEVGSAEKEGVVSWKRADSVKSVIGREFGLLQTTAYPSWDTWKGTSLQNPGFDFGNTNQVVDWAKSKGKKVAVHLLAGSPTYFPAWLNGGTWTAPQLDTLLNHWITFATTTNGNANKVDYWNVVNEAFMWNGSYWDSSTTANTNPWQKMGWEADKSGLSGTAKVYSEHPIYIRRAFELARQHTKAKLELRDYSIEFWDGSKKTRAFYQLVKHLLASGTPIDAVGFQGHFRTDVTYDWTKLRQAVAEYRKLGLEVYLTELDYGDADPVAAATSAHRNATFDTAQSRDYRGLVSAAVAGGINWICLWGVGDNTNTYWRMGQSALLFNESYLPKPSYYAFQQGILDGLSTASVGTDRTGTGPAPVVAQGRILRVRDASVGKVELRDLSGSVRARVELRDGRGAMPSLPSGRYVVSGVESTGALGLIAVW